MYHFIDDKEFLKKLRTTCSGLVNQLVQAINREGEMTVEAHLVGSGAKSLITQNGNEPVDLDYNLTILGVQDINDAHFIKEYVRKKFDEVLRANGWGNCDDSKSCLTTEKRHFCKGNQTEFSIDLAIVFERDDGSWFRLIHEKTGFYSMDRWFWNQGPNSEGLVRKVKQLKDERRWNDVRNAYLEKKNYYLRTNDYNHESFICYVEAVNEVYSQY